MADKRVIELIEKEKVNNNDYLIVDDAIDGTKKAKVSTLVEAAKETASEFKLTNTFEGSALAKTIYGMSVQNGTPTPSSPVEIKSAVADFKCVGKNLIPYPFKTNQTFDSPDGQVFRDVTMKYLGKNQFSFVGTSSGRIDCKIFAPNNASAKYLNKGTYKLTITHISGNNRNANVGLEYELNHVFNKTKARAYLTNSMSTHSATFTVTQEEIETYTMLLVLYGNASQTFNDVYEVELTLDGVDQTFELYKAAQVSTDLTLRAIEVTSSDDYNLVKDGKYYIADTLDWSEDEGFVITRRVKEQIISSASAFHLSTGTDRRFIAENIFTLAKGGGVVSYSKSDRFVYNSSGTQSWGIFRIAGDRTTLVLSDKDSSIESLDALDTWLSTNEPVFVYAIDAPYTEQITAEQALELLSLKTYNEATSIDATGDVAPMIELHYAKNEISAKALTGHNEGFKAQELNNLYGVKNLLRYPYYETTKVENGLTFTDNGDGTITVNGTASAETVFAFISSSGNLPLKEGSLYIATGCPKGGSESTYFIQWANGSWTYGKKDYGDGALVPIMNESTDYINYVRIIVKNGTVCNNLIFKPMLRLASIQSDEYEQYAMSNYELTKKVQELQATIDAMS